MSVQASSRKLYIGAVCILSGLLIIWGRLFYLQIVRGDAFYERGYNNFIRMEVLDSPRGNIVDRHGRLLATNRPVFDVYWVGRGSKRFDQDCRRYFDLASSILSFSDERRERLERQVRHAEYYHKRVLLAEDVSFALLCQMSEQCYECPHLVIVNRCGRIYPYHTLASHILGYLGREAPRSFVGRYGVEKLFQNKLQGTQGYAVHVTNATGRQLKEVERKQATMGDDIALTIDTHLQQIAESLFETEQAGACIVMDPFDGSVLVSVSHPGFDPNMFLTPVSSKEWGQLSGKKNPFLNRCVQAVYPPASLFKLITFAAGIEEGVITPETEHSCRGYVLFGKRKYRCIRRFGHGTLSSLEAVAHSCNIPCYEIGGRIGIDQLAEHAARFGLGMSTNYTIPDKSGLVPTTVWKAYTKKEPWWRGETLSCCIGQSYLLVTPLQVARMVSAICSGYLVKPRLLRDEEVMIEELEVAPTTLSFLRDAMRGAVKVGSARRLRNMKDFTIWAKTGTAQTSSLDSRSTSENSREHGWFAMYFSYKNQRPLTLITLVEHAGTAYPALRIAKKFLHAYAQVKQQEDREQNKTKNQSSIF